MTSAWRNGAAGVVLACMAASCGGETGRPPVATFGFDVPGADRGAPASCEGGSVCGGACVDLQRDPRHCGGCDTDCTGLPVSARAYSWPVSMSSTTTCSMRRSRS